MRIGIGYDVHRFESGRRLVLGGVTIDHDKGLSGHSDADVLLHAISDALLGAAGLGDLGLHFPPGDPRYRNISSRKLLEDVAKKIKVKGLMPNNIDSVIVAEAPKLSPYRDQMITNIAETLGIDRERVNVKATTEEGLGFTGAKQGIAAWAVATLEKSN